MEKVSFVDLLSRLPLAAVTIATLGFLRWLIPFVFDRLDVGAAAIGRRLTFVEAELARYREATMMLVSALAKESPTNPALREVARILAEIPPRPTMDVSEIVSGLANIPGTKDGRVK